MKKLYYTDEEQKEAKQRWDKQYREKNADALKKKKRDYYEANKERISSLQKEKYAANPEKAKKRSLEWKTLNKDKWNSKCMERHAIKLRACPSWLSEDDKWLIDQAYELSQLRERICGGKWHVDHIVPLRGKTVCGLHVPWNLQVIPASVNCSKRNAWEKYRGSN
jgi:hypothetical protein